MDPDPHLEEAAAPSALAIKLWKFGGD
jgi:hypothetical protein